MKNIYLLLLLIIFQSCLNRSDEKDLGQTLFKGYEKISKDDIPLVQGNENPKIIEMPDSGDGSIDLDKIIDSIYYVKLQTLPTSLIGNIDKILVLDEYIIVLDKYRAQSVFIFDKNGDFLTKISDVGRAPNEYSRIRDIAFNDKTQRILLYDDYSAKIMYFNLKGEYLESEKTYFQFANIGILEDQSILFDLLNGLNDHMPEIKKYNVIFGTPDKLSGKALSVNPKFTGVNIASVTNFNISQDEILYTPDFSDTIYSISSHSVNAKYHIKSDRSIKNFTNTDTNLDDYNEMLNSGNYDYFQGFCSEIPAALYFETAKGQQPLRYFYLKDSGILVGGNSLSFTSDSNIEYFAYPFTSFKNHFVGILNPEEFISSETNDVDKKENKVADIFSSVKLGDNPILMFYSIK